MKILRKDLSEKIITHIYLSMIGADDPSKDEGINGMQWLQMQWYIDLEVAENEAAKTMLKAQTHKRTHMASEDAFFTLSPRDKVLETHLFTQSSLQDFWNWKKSFPICPGSKHSITIKTDYFVNLLVILSSVMVLLDLRYPGNEHLENAAMVKFFWCLPHPVNKR